MSAVATAAATQHGASSASASSATADDRLTDLYYKLMLFLRYLLVDVCSCSSPSWVQPHECLRMVYDLFDEWSERGARQHYALFDEPALLKHEEI